MAKVTKQIGFTIDIDEEAIAPASVNVFIYQLLNRLNYEHDIKSITIDDVTVPITNPEQLEAISLGEDLDLNVEVQRIEEAQAIEAAIEEVDGILSEKLDTKK